MSYQPKTGQQCSCRRGLVRDNCPACEGTGWVIDFAAIRERSAALRKDENRGPMPICPNCGQWQHLGEIGTPSEGIWDCFNNCVSKGLVREA